MIAEDWGEGKGRFDRLSVRARGRVALRDERGKLRAGWEPRGRVLEIGARGEVARWRIGEPEAGIERLGE